MALTTKREIEFRLPVSVPENFQIVVESGESVKPGSVIARSQEETEKSWNLHEEFGSDGEKYLLVDDGSLIQAGVVMASHQVDKNNEQKLLAPFAGRVIIDLETSTLRLERLEQGGEILAEHNAVVAVNESGVELVFSAWALGFDYGWGGSVAGQLMMAGDAVGSTLAWLNGSYRGAVLVVPYLTQHLWHKANALGVLAIVCGTVPTNYELWLDEDRDTACLLSYDGDEEKWLETVKFLSLRSLQMAYVIGEQKQLIVEKTVSNLKAKK